MMTIYDACWQSEERERERDGFVIDQTSSTGGTYDLCIYFFWLRNETKRKKKRILPIARKQYR